MGLLAYPGQGACKSLYTVYHATTRALVVQKRIEEGAYISGNSARGYYNEQTIIQIFDNIRSDNV